MVDMFFFYVCVDSFVSPQECRQCVALSDDFFVVGYPAHAAYMSHRALEVLGAILEDH